MTALPPLGTISALPAGEVLSLAGSVLHEPGRPHWAVVAELLGTIDARRLYEPTYRTLEAWAVQELDLPPHVIDEARWLHTAIRESGVGVERWARLTRAKAVIVVRAMGFGGSASEWLVKAEAAESATALRDELTRLAGDEVWIRKTIPMPAELGALYDAAMILAAVEVSEGAITREEAQVRIDDRRWAFRYLEAILRSYVEHHGGEVNEPRP